MAIRLHTILKLEEFYALIAEVDPGSRRAFHFAEDVEPERMNPCMLFCDEFDYLGQRIAPGTTTAELPTRKAGTYIMKPVKQDGPSYYFNAFRNDWNGDFVDQPRVNAKKVVLQPGERYTVEKNQVLMIGIGKVRLHRKGKVMEIEPPMLVDARPGDIEVEALTEATFCEAWV